MSRVQKKSPKPASAAEISSRVGNVLRFLPMSTDDLRANVVLHEADAEVFDQMLSTLTSTGSVIEDGVWLRLQTTEAV